MIDLSVNYTIPDSFGDDKLGVLGRIQRQLLWHIGETNFGVGKRDSTDSSLDNIVTKTKNKRICSVVFEVGAILFEDYGKLALVFHTQDYLYWTRPSYQYGRIASNESKAKFMFQGVFNGTVLTVSDFSKFFWRNRARSGISPINKSTTVNNFVADWRNPMAEIWGAFLRAGKN